MVGKAITYAVIFTLSGAVAAAAEGAMGQMFPRDNSCYERVYSPDHLNAHPAQRVTRIALIPDRSGVESALQLWAQITLRGVPGGEFEALTYCRNKGSAALYCTIEGDGGDFTVSLAKGGAVLVSVGDRGMSFEGDRSFETLEATRGDDRSFLLQPRACQ